MFDFPYLSPFLPPSFPSFFFLSFFDRNFPFILMGLQPSHRDRDQRTALLMTRQQTGLQKLSELKSRQTLPLPLVIETSC